MEANKEYNTKAIMLIVKCLTNLHAGNGDVNYNIIGNEVERDPVTDYPTINASGVKGALRAFLKEEADADKWFGGEADPQAGKLKILNASLLAIPMRATKGDKPYCMVYTETMKKQYEELCDVFHIDPIMEKEVPVKQESAPYAEGYLLQYMSKLKGTDWPDSQELYRMEHKYFKACDLPVIARNALDENEKSKNLWYEEVVPHKSIFYIPVIAERKDGDLLKSFQTAVDGKVIQFGGHASIGYGLCRIFVKEGE